MEVQSAQQFVQSAQQALVTAEAEVAARAQELRELQIKAATAGSDEPLATPIGMITCTFQSIKTSSAVSEVPLTTAESEIKLIFGRLQEMATSAGGTAKTRTLRRSSSDPALSPSKQTEPELSGYRRLGKKSKPAAPADPGFTAASSGPPLQHAEGHSELQPQMLHLERVADEVRVNSEEEDNL